MRQKSKLKINYNKMRALSAQIKKIHLISEILAKIFQEKNNNPVSGTVNGVQSLSQRLHFCGRDWTPCKLSNFYYN